MNATCEKARNIFRKQLELFALLHNVELMYACVSSHINDVFFRFEGNYSVVLSSRILQPFNGLEIVKAAFNQYIILHNIPSIDINFIRFSMDFSFFQNTVHLYDRTVAQNKELTILDIACLDNCPIGIINVVNIFDKLIFFLSELHDFSLIYKLIPKSIYI